jgi:shikimate dehydrogenase
MKLFSIFGDPVSHSISPLMHNLAIRELNLDACYTRVHLKDGDKLRETFFKLLLDGANITVPHKEQAYRQCDEIRGIAKKIKAVNTIVRKDDKLIGYNTDALGFYESIKEFGLVKNALIIGAGGTAKAIAIILRQNQVAVEILNRSKNRLDFFINEGFDTHTWDDSINKSYDLVINTTSAGLENEILPAPEKLLDQIFLTAKYAVDVIYNKKTPFLKKALSYSLPVKDGADMLLYQGAIAFNLFYDEKFSLAQIAKHMKQTMIL